MPEFKSSMMERAIKLKLSGMATQIESVRSRFNELNRRDYYKTTRTVCFCSDNPVTSEFAQSILTKRFFHGKGVPTDSVLSSILAPIVEQSVERVFGDRLRQSKFWDVFAHTLNRVEPNFVFLHVLSESPVIGGLRSKAELRHGLDSGLISCSVWVESDDRSNRSRKSKYAISCHDCDFVITAGPTRVGQVRKIEKLGNILYSRF